MQIPTIAEQIPTKLPLWGETWGFGANGDFLFALSSFFLVVATSILTVTERVGATITKKNNFLISGVTEEAAATITVRATFFF